MPLSISKSKKYGLSEWIALLLTLLLVLSLIPLCAVSRYDHASSDDFGYSIDTKAAVQSGSIVDVLSAALDKSVSSYQSWQGSYAATFLFALQPGIYSSGSYGLTCYIMLAALLGSTLILFMTLGVHLLHCKRSHVLILFSACMLVTVHFMPDPCQAFFWYNGASYYTLFYAFSLLLFSCVLKLLSGTKVPALFFALSLLLAVLIGGGNYSTGLLSCEGMALLTVWAFQKKHPRKISILILTLVLLACFALSVLAPGNQVRSAESTGLSPLHAIIKSLLYGAYKLVTWTNLPQIAFAVCIFPFLLIMARQSGFMPKHPLLILLLGYGLFSSQMTPALYGMSTLGGGRQIDIYYDAYYLYLILAMFLLCCRLNQKGLLKDFPEKNHFASGKRILAFALVLCLLSGSACANYGFTKITCVDTALSLYRGEAQAYDREYRAIEQTLLDNPKDAVVSEVKTCPDFFLRFGMEFKWVRTDMKKYYGIKNFTYQEEQ